MALNPALVQLARIRTWNDMREKVAVVPPGGGAPPGGDPAAAGGMPPGGAPPGSALPMGAAPPAPPPAPAPPPMPGMAPGMPPGGAMPGAPGAVDPMTGQPMPQAAPQKIKPEQMMQMLDFRMYNLQQQLTAIMNSLNIQLPPGALVLPPGSTVAPPAEAAMPGGPSDPAQAGGGQEQGGGQSAISPIDPMQGASPELAQGGMGGGGGGGEKAASLVDWTLPVRQPKPPLNLHASFGDLIEKMAEGAELPAGPRSSSPPKPLQGAHPGKRPATQGITAGGSKDPLSNTETSADMGAINKTAAQRFADAMVEPERPVSYIGDPFAHVMQHNTPATNAAAVAAMLRSRAAVGSR